MFSDAFSGFELGWKASVRVVMKAADQPVDFAVCAVEKTMGDVKKPLCEGDNGFEKMVPGNGLEPLHREAQASETCVSTNSTTRAGMSRQEHAPAEGEASQEWPGLMSRGD